MRIGELATRSGVPRTALRYYEQAGLLDPPRRTVSGYRAYDSEALPRLAFIRAAQAVGLSLGDIREVLRIRDRGVAPCEHLIGLVEKRRTEVRARLRELRQLERDLARLVTRGGELDPANCDPDGVCTLIGPLPHPAGRTR